MKEFFALQESFDSQGWDGVKLSNAELDYAEKYEMLVKEHFTHCVLDQLPEPFRKFSEADDGGEAMRPNPDTYVFCRIKEDLGEVQLDEHAADSRTPLNEGDLQVLRYLPIQALVENDDVELI